MFQLTLVRHGQANSDARDEDSYDQLSALGHQQARWLGAHFTAKNVDFDRVYCGTLRRHIETARGIVPTRESGFIQDPRLNELEYFTLAQMLYEQQGIAVPKDRDGFCEHLPMLFTAWANNDIAHPPESFHNFESRISAVLDDIAATECPALVVTSGGVIGMMMRLTMGLDLTHMSRACLSIMNASVHLWQPLGPNLTLTQFNAVPHLDHSDRADAKTYL